MDMRKRGVADTDLLTLSPGMAHFYALLPYSVTGLDVAAPASVLQGDTIELGVKLKIDKGIPGDHVIRVETRDPAGAPIYYYSSNLMSARGVASYKIALPLNAAPGKWRITAIDLPSGKQQTADVQVVPGKRSASAEGTAAPTALSAAPAAPVAGEKPADSWAKASRPPRETFRPESKEVSFDLSASILKNPALLPGPDGMPANWEPGVIDTSYRPIKVSSVLRIEQDPNVLFMGKPATKITVGPSEKEAILQMGQPISMAAMDLRGKKLRLTFYAYREKPPADREFFVVAPLMSKGPDGKDECKRSILSVTPSIPPGTWVRCFAEGTVHPETTSFHLSLRDKFLREDTFWISGFLLEIVE
jgi:hypothetical protein